MVPVARRPARARGPASFDEFGPLAKHLRYAERRSRKLARSTFYAMGRYQAKLEQKGALLGRHRRHRRRAVRDRRAPASTRTTLAASSPTAATRPYELADLFCKQARRRAERLFDELFANDDAPQYEVAQQVLEGRYDWFEDDVLDPAGDGPMIPEHAPPAEERLGGSAPPERVPATQ